MRWGKGVRMRTTLQGLGRALAAGSAVLVLAACGSGSTMVTNSDETTAEAKAATTTVGAAAAPVSATVKGTVVDQSGRKVANANVECLGDVHCTLPDDQVSAQGHQHRIAQTDANGAFEIVATNLSGNTSSGFMMNVNGLGYEVAWQPVAWPGPACTSDQPRCTVTVSFTLNPTAEPAQ
jgi:hypothetical protein